MARAPVSKTGGWGFEVPPLLPAHPSEIVVDFILVRFADKQFCYRFATICLQPGAGLKAAAELRLWIF